jgi:hypothetical protein
MNNELPARVQARRAMELLSVRTWATFRKVVDANPDLVHRLPGESRARYSTAVIASLLARRASPGEDHRTP